VEFYGLSDTKNRPYLKHYNTLSKTSLKQSISSGIGQNDLSLSIIPTVEYKGARFRLKQRKQSEVIRDPPKTITHLNSHAS
jgi:hypothetical protein